MNKAKHRTPSVIESAPKPMSSTAFDRALSKVAVELSADDAASLRWEPPTSTASNQGGSGSGAKSPSPRNGPGGTISDTCNFYMTATSFSEPRIQDPLEALDPTFRKIVGWKKRGADLNGATDTVVFMRRPAREFAAGAGLRFVALDPETYQGKALLEQATHQEFWDVQINGRPFSMPFLKSGAAIWKRLGIKVEPETTAYMMQMRSVDTETSEAIQSALWSAFNTAQYPIDIETAVFVLAAFIHADPLRKRLVADETFVHPYGDRTAYGLGRFYEDGDD
jgi:hypothetical protein